MQNTNTSFNNQATKTQSTDKPRAGDTCPETGKIYIKRSPTMPISLPEGSNFKYMP